MFASNSHSTTVNYILGFVIVLLIFIFVLSYTRPPEMPRVRSETHNLDRQITLITLKGPLKINHALLEHYLTRLNSNLEYIIKRADTSRCDESIQQKLQRAKDKLHTQITETIENVPTKPTELQEDGDQVRNRINILSNVMFENNQNEDAPQSTEVMYEIMYDIERLIRIARLKKENSPDEQFTLDIKDVDQIIQTIYQTACDLPPFRYEHSEPPPVRSQQNTPAHLGLAPIAPPTIFSSTTDINDIDTDPKSLTFGTYVDRHKHQDIKAETDTFKSKRTSLKERKQGLVNTRRISLSTHEPKNQITSKLTDNHSPTPIRHVPSHEERGLSSSMRIKTAQENFQLERPHRHKKTKDALVDAYDHLDMNA